MENSKRDSGSSQSTSCWNSSENQVSSSVLLQISGDYVFSMEDRVDRRGGGRQSFDHLPKRQRPDYLDDEVEDDDYGKRPKKSIQSTVVMPALDSKGRDEKIEKLKETENKDSKLRNRRLFSNLIMGTLSSFKKTDRKTTQQEKQEEVEKRLEEIKQKDLNAVRISIRMHFTNFWCFQRREEKHELLNKRREQEKELQGLQRKKALIQYAEHKIKQLGFMKGSIQTTAEPKIFWKPIKTTARSLELTQATEKQLDSKIKPNFPFSNLKILSELIKEREEQLAHDLEARRKNEERDEHKEDDNDRESDEYEEDKNENEKIEVVLKTEDDLKREEEEEIKEEDIDVHVELD